MQRSETIATSLDDAGLGVGVEQGTGRELHVVDLLPGERAEVAIDHASPHKAIAWAHIVKRFNEPSDDRVAPLCPAFGRCGGCTWQHLAYPAQLVEKRHKVTVALAEVPAVRAGSVDIAPVRPAPSIVGYRNKGKYVAGKSGDHVILGAYAPRSHHVIDTLGCRVVAPVIDEIATWIRGAAEAAGLVPYDERKGIGELRYVIVRESAGDALIAVVVAPGTPWSKLEQLGAAVHKHPAVRGLVAVENDRKDGAIIPSGSSPQIVFGEAVLVEQLAGVPVEVGAGEFLQVNRAQAAAMYERVAELAMQDGAKRAIDLYAGLGGIALHLARAGAEVVAVEIDRDAIAQLRRAATAAKLPLVALAGDAGDLPRALRTQLGAAPDVVVVNPPRKGLGAGARALLGELAAPTIVYASCGPEALGRDLVALAAAGWHPDAIEPFDLMPGTAQVETVVRLRR